MIALDLKTNYVSVSILAFNMLAFNIIGGKKPLINKIENKSNDSAKRSNTHWSQILVLGLGRKYILRLILYAGFQPVLDSTFQG